MDNNTIKELGLELLEQKDGYSVFKHIQSNKKVLYAESWTPNEKKAKVKKSDENRLADVYIDEKDGEIVFKNGSGNIDKKNRCI